MLALDADRRGQLRAQGLCAATEFSWQATARQTLDVYRAAAKPRGLEPTEPRAREAWTPHGFFHVSHVRTICPAIFCGSASGIGSNFCTRPAKQSAR